MREAAVRKRFAGLDSKVEFLSSGAWEIQTFPSVAYTRAEFSDDFRIGGGDAVPLRRIACDIVALAGSATELHEVLAFWLRWVTGNRGQRE